MVVADGQVDDNDDDDDDVDVVVVSVFSCADVSWRNSPAKAADEEKVESETIDMI